MWQGLNKKISELQRKPYQTRIRILWTSVIIASTVILVVWFVTLRFRDRAAQDEQSVGKFRTILDNLKKLKDIRK